MATDWNKVAEKFWPILVGLAENREIRSYKWLAKNADTDEVKLIPLNVYKGLEPIQKFCLENGYPILTALIVQERNGKYLKPCDGFAWNNVSSWEKERDKVFQFPWRSVEFTEDSKHSVEIKKTNLKSLINFIRDLDGATLETLTQHKRFRVDVDLNSVYFLPERSKSSEGRPLSFASEIERYLVEYEHGGNKFEGSRWWNVSYFRAIMDEYYKRPKQSIHAPDGEGSGRTKKEVEILSRARVGQGKFRQDLLEFWEGTCSVTEVANPNFLRASHIKPWKNSNDEECVNKYNGLLLTPNLDMLFDGGWITFDAEGKIKISHEASSHELKKLGVQKNMHLRKIDDPHKKFLAYHREKVFRKK